MRVLEAVSAAKAKLGRDAALDLAKSTSKIIIARGKRVTTFDMKGSPPDDETLLEQMLGPTGNLRAPTIRIGKTLLIGFNEETYTQTLLQAG